MSDLSDRQQLITENQGLVHSLAAKIAKSLPVKADIDDLIGYGELGLAQATRDFDPSRGVEFSSFAYYRIRGAIYDGIAQMTWTSRAQYRRLRNLQLAEAVVDEDAQSVLAKGGESLASSVSWLRSVTDKLAAVYLTSQFCDNESQFAVEDPMESAHSIVAQQEISQQLHRLIDELPHVERRLIRGVYLEGETLQTIGKSLGISRSWASRLHAKALDMLAQRLKRIGVET